MVEFCFLGLLRIRRSDTIKKTVPGTRHEELEKKNAPLQNQLCKLLR